MQSDELRKVRFASTFIKSEFAKCDKSGYISFHNAFIVIFNISQDDLINIKEHVKGFCSAR
jgi:hypothetical protein